MQNLICIAKSEGSDISTLSHFSLFRAVSAMSAPLASIRTIISVAKERQALKNLPVERLDDIGYSTQDVETEANRGVWDVPSHWKR